MKKIWYFIRNMLMGIVVIFALALSPFVFAFRLPFRYAEYRKSHFFRDNGLKFSPFIADSYTFRLYELFRRENLGIRYLMPKDPKQAADGFFLAGSTLLIHNLSGIFYEEHLGGWTAYPEDEEPLSDTVAKILLHLRSEYPEQTVTDVRILLEWDNEVPENRDQAKQEPLFVVYEDAEELPRLLRPLCG